MSLIKKKRKTDAPVEKKNPQVNEGFRKLKILVTVVNRSKTEFYMDLLSDFEVNFQTAVLAQGTARSETLYMLGLEDSDKSVIFSVIREDKAAEALQTLEDKFNALKNGKNIVQ